ncbi:MAG: type I DNA topoisomerase [Pseudomonadota bacterium]
MSKSLIIVESPTKVKTIGKYLGREFIVKASVGHVWDLPKSKLGIEVGDSFVPQYEVIKGKQKVVDEIKKAAKEVATVYLAPDPDREGEAIAWHLAEAIQGKTKKTKAAAPKIFRILIDEITKQGVQRAMAAPGELDRAKYESQQARRILDRLVGYKISPLLWDKVRRGLSAGRVQSVALRIVCEREREVRAFIPAEYWTIDVTAEASEPPPFLLHLISKNGEKIEIPAKKEAEAAEADLRKQILTVSDVQTKERRRTPPPAFTTSKLQQESARKLGFGPKKTMLLAQQLYEGVELGEEGAVGLITYMRTDSTRLSNEAINVAREFIEENFGKEYLPENPRFYKTAKKAQDAHEAIRPTLLVHPPEKVKKFLKRDQFALYQLIWNRFLACQMAEAVYDQTTIDVKAGPYGLRATGSVLRSDGYMKLYIEGTDDADADEEKAEQFPALKPGDPLTVSTILPEQHFTKPPFRFTEASLIKELEENGIGRPSTYASILSTLQDRKYAMRNTGGSLEPTDLGFLVNDLLVEHFKDVMEVEFTAQMEEQLDRVEEGEGDWQELLRKFYDPFMKDLKSATKMMRDVKREETPTDIVCEKCGKMMVIKWGRHGHFLACSAYPECRNTKEFRKKEDGAIEVLKQETTDEVCDVCGSPMAVKTGRFGKFLACSRYPDCKTTRSISTGVPCPEAECGGKLLERRTRRGRSFYGCSKYPKCKHALWNKPIVSVCPSCQAPYLVEKFTKKTGPVLQCVKKSCGYSRPIEEGKPPTP